ncbi:MAG: hypothetical protein LC768_14035 [Acidobacteria bacterium]|nr:hypothetical protein [Acidobacteriota bacterium]MCA1639432.1 hypothetical protein [Acidobacteriota bacterium]
MKLLQKLRVLFLSFLILSSVNSVFSQSKETEKRLSDTIGGYSFAAPPGFDSKQNEEGFGLVNTEKTVVIAVKNHNFKSFEEFSAQSNLEKDGFSLIGKVQDFDKKGKVFLVAKQTAEGVLMVDTFVLFSPYGGGTLIVAFSEKDDNQKRFQAALQIAKSVTFTKPQISEAASQWQTLLRGKHLLYLYTASGFSERTDIYLCSSGAFFYRSDSSSLSNNGSGIVGTNSDGNWKISSNGGGSLILQFGNGTVREYKISRRQAGNEIGLNGNRYFVQTQNECR